MPNPLLDTVTNNNIDTLIEPRSLQERITELANEITIDYQNQEFILVCILRGGDTGHTLKQVLELLNSRSPKSLRVCTLLDKHERREVDIKIDYVGFQIPDKFVIGFGLDDENGYWRNLPYIGVARPQ